MSRVWHDGFDLGDMAVKYRTTGTISSTTTTRFSLGRAGDVSASGGIWKDFTAASQVFVGVALSSSLVDTTIRPLITFWGDAGVTQHITIGLKSTGIEVRRGNNGGTLLASYAATFAANTFYYIEASATIADSGGTVEVRYLGASVISFSGDTKNAGTNTTIDAVGIQCNGTHNVRPDDFYINNSSGSAPLNGFLGDSRIYSLVGTGAGSSTQWAPDTGSNYARVNEIPYSAANYVLDGTTGHRDTYAMGDLPSPVGSIYDVQLCVIGKKSDAGAMSVKGAIKSGSTVYYGTTTSLGTTDAVIVDAWATDPNTSATWTASGVNALEAGMEVV